ncbi:uncharacterized protein LOC135370261 [Ornithodoros turicata]|uniref:uncharacterized protein LOC135370261 n=1 Tax=Ornithodoros turicata TaxID=34597 RepID=UPI00313877FB
MNDAMDRDVATMASSIELSVKDYISTLTGILNLLEVLLGLLLLLVVHYTLRELTTRVRVLFTINYAYTFNGLHFIIAGCLSLESFSHLQELFYYVLFLTCAGMAYTIGSVCVIKESKSTPVFAILSVTIGGIYYIHAVYAVIRLL